MSVVVAKPCCVTCRKEITVLKCEGCWRTICNSTLIVQCQETLPQQKAKTQQHSLIQQVDDWECNAMNQIRQTAEEARRLILKHTTDRICQIEAKLTKLTEQLRECHLENNFIAKNVSQWQEELVHLTKQLTAPSSITVQQVSSPLVSKIIVDIPGKNFSIFDN
jgi:hypothetical protein